MTILLSLIISLTTNTNSEPQIGYWVCDAIRQEKKVDFVILPNSVFIDMSNETDTLVVTSISIKELNQILSKNLVLPNFIPISGFTVIIDSLGNYMAVPNNVKDKYSFITTKSLCNSDKATKLSEGIISIFVSYLNKEKHIVFPKTNRYQFMFQPYQLKQSNESQIKEEKITNKININTATKEELETLPGIGPKTAQKIINYRNENGPFKSIKEIQNVSGIGPKKYEQIKNLITI